MLPKFRIFLTIAITLAFCSGVPRGLAESHPAAPRLSFTNLTGDKVNLDDYKGSVILLNFWTTSCSVCLSEIPTLSSLQDRYGSQGLRVLGVAVDDQAASIRKVIEQRHINYTIALGNDRMEEEFGADGFPVTLVIGRDGRIYSQHSGAIRAQDLEAEVTQLLAGGPDVSVNDFHSSAGAKSARIPTSAELKSEIPGVDLSGLDESQIAELKQQLESEPCPCGCNRSLLKCRSSHSSCQQSKTLASRAAEKLHPPMI